MRILRSPTSPSATYYNCHIESGERSKCPIGERILFDDGDVVVGPLKVVGGETHKIVVTADDDYAVYERTDADEIELEELEPIIRLDYTPITNSIFLDGFLGAAYADDSGIIRVDIDPSLTGLKNYYIDLMNDNGIEYRSTEDGFVFPDPTVIEAIFEKQSDSMPPKYVIGFLSSFIVKSRIRINRNPRYEKYMFVLPAAEEYYEGMAPKGLYYYSLRGQCALFSIFGSFEPLAHYIDSIEPVADEPIFVDTIHMDDIFREVAPDLIIKSLSLTGCNPRPLGNDGSIAYCGVTVKDGDKSRTVVLAIAMDEKEPKNGCNYVIRFEGRKPILFDLSENGMENHVVHDLFYHPAFNYSKELRDYLQIIFNKM